ncbi:carbohydrate ABC transporter permease [Cytobacillus sp. IB215665]|uniref:carbohydrate ABC transporter permease n=1 Tax=Cytobacillus sp. IB215665 TaxID=3097357 RepID=UPI002A0DD806|nr:carbohydrate ABC transporter permease [Cytobacillus sp. IB215665]MDX8364550.1 carbohydrate ABC transporter permease [Cytobacillus sp. IB215665]
MKTSKTIKLLSYSTVFIMLVLYLVPLLLVVNTAFKTNPEFIISPNSIAENFNFQNFLDAWQQGSFSTYVWNTLLYTGVSTVIVIIFSIFAAFPIARGYVKWSGLLYIFFTMSMFLPNPLVPQFRLMVETGLYNTQLGYILIRSTGFGVVFILFVGYIKSISKELDEAASIDGCGYGRYMFSVIMPLMKPIIATGIVLTAIGTWNDLLGPILYLSDSKLWSISAGLLNFQGQYGNNWPLLSCGILIVAAPLLILYIFLQKYIIEGTMSGAVKS